MKIEQPIHTPRQRHMQTMLSIYTQIQLPQHESAITPYTNSKYVYEMAVSVYTILNCVDTPPKSKQSVNTPNEIHAPSQSSINTPMLVHHPCKMTSYTMINIFVYSTVIKHQINKMNAFIQSTSNKIMCKVIEQFMLNQC